MADAEHGSGIDGDAAAQLAPRQDVVDAAIPPPTCDVDGGGANDSNLSPCGQPAPSGEKGRSARFEYGEQRIDPSESGTGVTPVVDAGRHRRQSTR